MIASLYSLSLRTLQWRLLWPPPPSSSSEERATPTPTGPAPRYFHSCEAWGTKLVIFGGEGYAESESGAGDGGADDEELAPLCTLGDLCIWDTQTNSWEFPLPECDEGVEPPAPRYAHLGVVSTVIEGGSEKSAMLLMGGQDIRNTCECLLTRPASARRSRASLGRPPINERPRPGRHALGQIESVGQVDGNVSSCGHYISVDCRTRWIPSLVQQSLQHEWQFERRLHQQRRRISSGICNGQKQEGGVQEGLGRRRRRDGVGTGAWRDARAAQLLGEADFGPT